MTKQVRNNKGPHCELAVNIACRVELLSVIWRDINGFSYTPLHCSTLAQVYRAP